MRDSTPASRGSGRPSALRDQVVSAVMLRRLPSGSLNHAVDTGPVVAMEFSVLIAPTPGLVDGHPEDVSFLRIGISSMMKAASALARSEGPKRPLCIFCEHELT